MSMLFPRIAFDMDETPMSWAARQAAFHTGGRVVPFLNDFGIPVADLARGKREAAERLCEVAGQDPDPVLRNLIMTVGNRRFQLRGHEFSAEFTTGVVTRFCPLCLEEDAKGADDPDTAMRHRVLWRLAPFRACPAHGLPLTDVRIGKWSDMVHELQAMSGAIEEARVSSDNAVRREPSPMQTYVVRRLAGAASASWLDRQGIEQVCRAAEMLGGLMLFGPSQKAASMTEDMWDAAARNAWPLMEAGPEPVRDFLGQTLASCLRRNGHPSPRNAFGMLHSWLSASRLSKDPGPVRDILREVIIERVPFIPGQVLLGKPVADPRLASISSVAKAEGMHSKTLTNVLRVAGLIGGDEDLRAARNVVTDYAKAKDLIDIAKHAVPVTQVPDMLTASRPVVAELIAMEQLVRIKEHGQLKSKLGKAIDGRSIHRVRTFIEELGEAVDEAPETHVPLAKSAEKCRVTMRVILEMLFNGYLKSICRFEGHNGFEAVLVSPNEITECLQDPPPNAPDEIRFWMG
ncbi:TniQ family protein [Gymnodinialimonas ulvae]|uniref:TniQ family protein n=1 Tax=Gymnodinialimonas ulvae TaxID=3126504 RepID=UPI0030AA82EC